MAGNTTFFLREADNYIDYDTFLSDEFDANSYANTIVNQSGTGDGSDIGTALAKLSFSIDSLNKQIQEQVTDNYEDLLGQVTGIKNLETVLATVKANIQELKLSLRKLVSKIKDPYHQLQSYTTQLENLQQTCELLRRLHRFLLLKRRLEGQLPSTENTSIEPDSMAGRDLSAAALTVHELETIVNESDFEGIHIVTKELAFIETARQRVESEADRLLKDGVNTQSQAKMAAGLQIFHNMRQMSTRVQELTNGMLDDLARNIKHVVDMHSLQKEMKGNHPNVRRTNNEPSFGNQQALAQAIWGRMETLMQSMSDSCIKIYDLEKVLEIKKDSLSQVTFLEEVAKMFDATSLVSHFWRVLSATFERELKEATKVSTFLQNTFVGGYPKLLQLLHEFFSRVAIHNGTSLHDYAQSPEYVIMLRSFNIFESGFLARSLTRMHDTINATFPAHGGLSRTAPGRQSILTITRVIEHELETAAFEPHLAQAVARNVVKTLNMFCAKCEALIPNTDQSVYTATQNNTIFMSLSRKIELINITYYMHQSIWKVLEEYPEKMVDIIIKGSEECRRVMLSIGQNLVDGIKLDILRVLIRMHQEDFSGQANRNFNPMEDDSASAYVKELAKHIRYHHSQILSRLSCGTEPKSWVRQIGKYMLHVFVFQASLISPLSEAGKLKLAGDMAEIEFITSSFLSDYGVRIEEIGDEYKALRVLRPLLFLDSVQLTAAHHTAGLSKLVLIHHLVVRSQSSTPRLALPYSVYDLSPREYMEWMERLSEQEQVSLAVDAITKGSNLTAHELETIPENRLIIEIAEQLSSPSI
ncbi:Golgi transport complex subunit 5-domain-containing protein [Radiomyces spectabilis]|uniref:Golgi transport complex subunit 5-domain-containing protein n=1 Tax=Radiomyces spectabilis TaxID=64574 RepID=UPI002220C075|nr:Golgi transport complex subunit 5-domain-containing protein [Radiomyces spectabilis]KAI8388643.1 Golgi transport complex subunit 5-domain-containing protein [Radiomyces spectabilis]